MLGAVWAMGTVEPLGSRPVAGVPGFTSTVMSCRFVFGRISSVVS